jgi:hypothetical protein
VIDLLGQPDRLEAFRRACVAFAEQHFSWAAIERQLRAAVDAVFPDQVAHVEGSSANSG